MTYSPGFGLPDLMSPISELRQAVADLEAQPPTLARDKTLAGLRGTLEIRERELAEGTGTEEGGFRPAPTEHS